MNERIVKTKILTTIGPASDSEENLLSLIDTGADAFRLNFSHGTYDYYENLFNKINSVCEKRSLPIPIIQDLQGPKIRIGNLAFESIEISRGEEIEITVEKIEGTRQAISTSYPYLVEDAAIGNTILIDDGLIHLEIIGKKDKSVVCKVIEGGLLKPHKGMNLPGMKLSTPALTEKDKEDLEFGLKHRVDFIALSFVRHAEDILHLRNWLKERGSDKPIIAKIEKPEGVDNFESILEAADGIMVARGDLGVELPTQLVPIIQKNIIKRCNAVGKLVITATQMLESMIQHSVPTRAEASDVANAVLDGTDVVMLSGETSVGKYPIDAVKMMNDILLTTESQTQFAPVIKYDMPLSLADNLFDATGRGFTDIANQINTAAVVIFTHFGRKAKVMSKFRPRAPIFAVSNKFETLNVLNLYRGIVPLYLEKFENEEASILEITNLLKQKEFVKKGDVILFTSGAPITDKDRRNWIRFSVV